MMPTPSELSDELSQIIAAHAADVEQYVLGGQAYVQTPSAGLVASVQRLIEITHLPPHAANSELYREACDCLDELVSFLRIMNYSAVRPNQTTAIDRVLRQANTWRDLVPRECKSTEKDVWELIAPAIPDHIEDLGSGHYEARWWKPVPVMDVEILKYTDGIRILEDPFEPASLSGGLALRFAIAPHATNVPAE